MNIKVFTKDDVSKGLHLKLIDCLARYGLESNSKEFNDVHVTTVDGDSLIVEWVSGSLEFPTEYFELMEID